MSRRGWRRLWFMATCASLLAALHWPARAPEARAADAPPVAERAASLEAENAASAAKLESLRQAHSTAVQLRKEQLGSLETTLAALQQQLARARSSKTREAPALDSARGAASSSTNEQQPPLSAVDEATLKAGFARVVSAATITGEQLKLYLDEVPGKDDEGRAVGRILSELDGGAPSTPITAGSDSLAKRGRALGQLLMAAQRTHADAARVTVRDTELWTAQGRQQNATLLSIGHAAHAYLSPTAGDVAIALGSPAEARGYRWSEQLDTRAKAQLRLAFGGAHTLTQPSLIDVPVDVSGQLRVDSQTQTASPAEIVEAGGYVMYPLGLIALLALLLILERAVVLYGLNRGAGQLGRRVLERCRDADFERAVELCARQRGAVPRTLEALISAREKGRTAMEDSVQEQLLHELPRLERRMGGIAILGAVAPLLGLLGTVTGIIQTFRVIHSYGNANPGLLAGGISEALTTTATGLCIAIPVLLLHSLLKGRLDRVLSDAERQAASLLNAVAPSVARMESSG